MQEAMRYSGKGISLGADSPSSAPHLPASLTASLQASPAQGGPRARGSACLAVCLGRKEQQSLLADFTGG